MKYFFMQTAEEIKFTLKKLNITGTVTEKWKKWKKWKLTSHN